MKKPLLSIVIPTYNRAAFVEEKFLWIEELLLSHGDLIEYLILDNASSDKTGEICKSWELKLEQKIRYIKNNTNIGLVPNCIKGLSLANGEFTWLVGDDDPISPAIIPRILAIIKEYQSLDLIHLNHRCVDGKTGQVINSHFYNLEKDVYESEKNIELIERLLEHKQTGGFMFITANILKTQKAKRFIQTYPLEEKYQLAYPLYLNLGMAATGSLYYFSTPLLDSVYYTGTWTEKFTDVAFKQIPEAIISLKKFGLPTKLLFDILNLQLNVNESFFSIITNLSLKNIRSKISELKNHSFMYINKKKYQWKLAVQ